jgi:hypothetical protein
MKIALLAVNEGSTPSMQQNQSDAKCLPECQTTNILGHVTAQAVCW